MADKFKKFFYRISIIVAGVFAIFVLIWKFVDFNEMDFEEIWEITWETTTEKLRDLAGFLLDFLF